MRKQFSNGIGIPLKTVTSGAAGLLCKKMRDLWVPNA